jgi:endonuclease/exonuclease/phosphatase family metal-dependent hydrolase
VQETKQKKRISFLSGFLLLLNLFAIFLLLMVYLSVYINPAKFSLLAFVGLSYPIILLINFVFVLIWIFIRIKYSLLSLVFILLGWNHLQQLVQIFPKNKIKKGTKTIKILSYNIQNFIGQNVSNTKYIDDFSNQTKITKFISELNADIVCLQEVLYDRGDIAKFGNDFGKKIKAPNYYYRNYHSSKTKKLDGIVIFTRYPVIKKGYLEYNEKTIGIYNDLIIQADTFRIYNLHLASIHFKREEYDFISDLPNQQDQEVIKKHSIKVLSKLKTAFVNRGQQVKILTEHIRSSPYAVIICGDFNDTPSSYAYYKLVSGLSDAFVESGNGFGVTYAGESFPSFRIDYILHDNSFESYRFARKKIALSDHYPVSCELVKKGK